MAASTPENPRELIAAESIAHNERLVSESKIFASVIGGFLCGILNITGFFNGIIFFAVISSLVSFLITQTMGPKKASKFFKSPSSVYTTGIFQSLMSFILFWTLGYDIVYIFY